VPEFVSLDGPEGTLRTQLEPAGPETFRPASCTWPMSRGRRNNGPVKPREMPGFAPWRGQTRDMPSREQTRTERLREHAALIERAHQVVGAMGLLVRGREARARDGATPLEVEFAKIDVDGRALPAGVWVALRRDDVAAAIDAMMVASQTNFLIEERDVMGEGYRLQSVEDTLPIPEADLLTAQLSCALDVPLDVLTVLAEWGPDDPRTASEIDELLTARFGPAERVIATAPPPAVDGSDADPNGQLTMTVGEAAQVLRLDEDQVRALTILVRNASVTLTMQ